MNKYLSYFTKTVGYIKIITLQKRETLVQIIEHAKNIISKTVIFKYKFGIIYNRN